MTEIALPLKSLSYLCILIDLAKRTRWNCGRTKSEKQRKRHIAYVCDVTLMVFCSLENRLRANFRDSFAFHIFIFAKSLGPVYLLYQKCSKMQNSAGYFFAKRDAFSRRYKFKILENCTRKNFSSSSSAFSIFTMGMTNTNLDWIFATVYIVEKWHFLEWMAPVQNDGLVSLCRVNCFLGLPITSVYTVIDLLNV